MKRRVLFMGQKPLGEKCFDLLYNASSDKLKLCGAVSNQRKKDVWWHSNHIHSVCRRHKIPFIPNAARSNEEVKFLIKKEGINTLVSVQHNWILPSDILALIDGEAYNLHNAKLPDYRGYNSYNHAILNRESSYTSTIHIMSGIVDMGHILIEETIEIYEHDTAHSIYCRANESATITFKKLLSFFEGKLSLSPAAIESEGEFYSKNAIDPLRKIKDIQDHSEVAMKSRAFYFPQFEPAYFISSGQKFYVLPDGFFSDDD